MNKDELIKKVAQNKDETKKLTENLEELKKEKEELNDILVGGLTFKSMSITKVICYLLTIYENKLYLPISGVYYPKNGVAYDYMALVPIDDFVALENKERYFFKGFKAKYGNQLVIVDEKRDFSDNVGNNNIHRLTFKHLLDEYGVQDIYKRVCIDSFDDYPYIKEFISMVASMQIENNGKHLDKDELWMVMSDFINLQKDKPKTKELNKNN